MTLTVTTEVISQADYLVDLHAGEGNEALRPFVYMAVTGDPETDEALRGMALAFGLDHIALYQAPPDSGPTVYTETEALDRETPALTTETGQLGTNDPIDVKMTERGVWNLLRHQPPSSHSLRECARARAGRTR